MDGQTVEVSLAAAGDKAVLERLFQLYCHDFSEFWDGAAVELGEDGRFPAYGALASYWRDKGPVPLLIRNGGRLAGFALVNGASRVGRPLDHNMAEFFIARAHRRGGVGTAAARAIFRRYPGAWEAAIVRANTEALAFWRKTVRGCPGVSEIRERDFKRPEWDGPVLSFRIG
jgi:predicted acetyltransferase